MYGSGIIDRAMEFDAVKLHHSETSLKKATDPFVEAAQAMKNKTVDVSLVLLVHLAGFRNGVLSSRVLFG